MLASDLVTSSLRLIGAIASGETPSSDESADGFTALQQLLAGWSANELVVFATRTAAITLANATQSYAIPGARPQKILSADVVTGGLTFPVKVVGPDEWAATVDRNAISNLTKKCYCDYAFPTPAVLVTPIPAAAGTLNLYCMVDLLVLTTQGDTFSMPEPYARAVRYNLACDLAAEYGRPVPPDIAAIAATAKAEITKLSASDRAGESTLALPPVQ
jgi:hypothetical protein